MKLSTLNRLYSLKLMPSGWQRAMFTSYEGNYCMLYFSHPQRSRTIHEKQILCNMKIIHYTKGTRLQYWLIVFRNNACEWYVSYIDDKNKLTNNNSCRIKVEFDFWTIVLISIKQWCMVSKFNCSKTTTPNKFTSNELDKVSFTFSSKRHINPKIE